MLKIAAPSLLGIYMLTLPFSTWGSSLIFILLGAIIVLLTINHFWGKDLPFWGFLGKDSMYQELAESITDPFMALNKQTKFTYWNTAAEMFFGIPSKNALGKSLYEIFPQIRNTPIEQKYSAVLNTKQPASMITNVEIKGVDLTLELNLYPTKDGVTVIAKDITEQKETEERIAFLDERDRLTGLFNRAYCKKMLQDIDIEANLPFSFILGGVNGLKLINDTFGHQVGDQILERISDILLQFCRPQDIVGRWGGDEFILILPNTTLDTATKLCSQIYEAVNVVDDLKVPPSISFGVATKEKFSQSIHHTLRVAETWMYRRKLIDKRSSKSAIIETLVKTLGVKDYETEEHTWRLQQLAMQMGEFLGLSYDQLDALSLLATLHDIGKVAISDNILMKPGALSPEEWASIKKHSEIGSQIAASLPELHSIGNAIEAHHERWDGKGYPRGLKEAEIPLISRIIAIIDAYDVMTNGRPYKEPISSQAAIEELQKCAGTQFDPYLVDIFVSLVGGETKEIAADSE